jgi:Holliday junction resolvase
VDQFSNPTVVWVAILAVALFEFVRRALARVFGRYQRRAVQVSAKRAEARAEQLLLRAGFRIVARQVAGESVLRVDGREKSFALAADLVVEKNGQRFIAEIKSGALVARLGHAETRRQLLEYAVAFGADAVLFVDMERERVHVVEFPALASFDVAA